MSIPISARSGKEGKENRSFDSFHGRRRFGWVCLHHLPTLPTPLLLFPYPEQTNCFLMKVFLSLPPFLPPLPPAEAPLGSAHQVHSFGLKGLCLGVRPPE